MSRISLCWPINMVLARSGKPVSPWERWEESSSPTSLFTLIRPETPLRETMTQIRLAWSRKDFPLAESLVEKLERMPHAELRNNAPDAAAIFMASDRREKGLALMRDELARNPRSEELKLRLARLLIALKRPEDALEMSDGAPSSSSPQFLYEMARASWLCGRPDQAEDTLLRLWESGTQTPVRFKLQVSCLLTLAMERRGEEPCSWLLHQMNALSEQDPLFLPMELQIIIQRLAAGDRPGAEERAWPLLQRAPYLFGLAFLLMDGRLQAGDFPGMEELMKIFHGSMSASPALFGQACCLARAGNLPLDPARTRAADSWLAETGASVLHTGCFSGKWYAARYSRTPHHGPGAQPPLSHYLTRTLLDLTSPNPLFDTRFYLGNCPHIFGYGLRRCLPVLIRASPLRSLMKKAIKSCTPAFCTQTNPPWPTRCKPALVRRRNLPEKRDDMAAIPVLSLPLRTESEAGRGVLSRQMTQAAQGAVQQRTQLVSLHQPHHSKGDGKKDILPKAPGAAQIERKARSAGKGHQRHARGRTHIQQNMRHASQPEPGQQHGQFRQAGNQTGQSGRGESGNPDCQPPPQPVRRPAVNLVECLALVGKKPGDFLVNDIRRDAPHPCRPDSQRRQPGQQRGPRPHNLMRNPFHTASISPHARGAVLPARGPAARRRPDRRIPPRALWATGQGLPA